MRAKLISFRARLSVSRRKPLMFASNPFCIARKAQQPCAASLRALRTSLLPCAQAAKNQSQSQKLCEQACATRPPEKNALRASLRTLRARPNASRVQLEARRPKQGHHTAAAHDCRDPHHRRIKADLVVSICLRASRCAPRRASCELSLLLKLQNDRTIHSFSLEAAAGTLGAIHLHDASTRP